jgi:hypothetical protein
MEFTEAFLYKELKALKARLAAVEGNQANGSVTNGTTAPTHNPTSANDIWFDNLHGRIYSAKPDLTGWITMLG